MTPSLPLPQDEPDFPPAVHGIVPPPLPSIPAAEAAEKAGTMDAGAAAPKARRPRRTPRRRPAPAAPPPPAPPLPDVAAADVAARYAEADGDVDDQTRPRPDRAERPAVFVVPPLPPLPAPVAAPPAAPADELTPPETSPFAPESLRTPTPGAARETPPRQTAVEVPEPDPVAEPEAVVAEPEAVVAEPEPVVAEPEPVVAETTAAPAPVVIEPPLPAPVVTASAADPLEDLPVIDHVAGVPALRLRGVTKSFGQTRAVDAVDLDIVAGTFYGVVGPNGAGKTTTLSMVAGLLRPDRGTIEINGVDLRREPTRAKRMMGILPDRLRTFDRLTGRQLLSYYGALRGLRGAVVESRTADLARAFDLTEALSRPVSDFSAGMTKKVMLAGAMIHSPRLLVLDEPFESVDPVSSAVIVDILRAYVAHGGTVVLSSHGMELVERVCSGVAVIVAGQVLAEGTVAQVRGELTLEQRFVELAGGLSDVEGLEWLHTFSD